MFFCRSLIWHLSNAFVCKLFETDEWSLWPNNTWILIDYIFLRWSHNKPHDWLPAYRSRRRDDNSELRFALQRAAWVGHGKQQVEVVRCFERRWINEPQTRKTIAFGSSPGQVKQSIGFEHGESQWLSLKFWRRWNLSKNIPDWEKLTKEAFQQRQQQRLSDS